MDLDHPYAVAIGNALLPRMFGETLIFGWPGKPMSHYSYRCEGATNKRHEPGKSMGGATLVELRSTGTQTVVEPPSTTCSARRSSS